MSDSTNPYASSDQNGSPHFVVRVPRGLRSKQRLFALFARALRFPAYFGWNWDAFEECLRDLSWLPAQATITVVHEDQPFAAGSRDRSIYREIIQAVAATPGSVIRVEGSPLR